LIGNKRPVVNLWHGIIPCFLLMLFFFIFPIIHTLRLSFIDPEIGTFTLNNYVSFFSKEIFYDSFFRTLKLAFSVIFFSILLSFPLAYFICFVINKKYRTLALLLLVAPFWTSFTIRAFSWQLILSDKGVITWFISFFTNYEVKLNFLYSMKASIFGLSLFGIMLTTLLLFNSMITIDKRLIEANSDLGGNKFNEIKNIIFPLSLPGLIIGSVLTFIISIGDYAVPTLLGGGFKPVLAQLMLSTIKGTYDLNTAATMALVLVFVIIIACVPLLSLIKQIRFER
tara:strand:- start:278 stop:1126 length:849 start_codon:yes stop_codon:yes gene_type:complete